jgi:hypothetical protein
MVKRQGVGIVSGGFDGHFHIKSFVGVRHAGYVPSTARESTTSSDLFKGKK